MSALRRASDPAQEIEAVEIRAEDGLVVDAVRGQVAGDAGIERAELPSHVTTVAASASRRPPRDETVGLSKQNCCEGHVRFGRWRVRDDSDTVSDTTRTRCQRRV